ncbi:MAG: flavin reductase family protein [Holosporales bacterium]
MQILQNDCKKTSSVSSDLFRQVMSQFATGVAILTSWDQDKEPLGMTINSLVSVSLQPSLIMFCLKKGGFFRTKLDVGSSVGVNILGAQQEHLSRHFARYETRDWQQVTLEANERAPQFRGSVGFLAGSVRAIYDGGDHDIMLVEVEGLAHSEVDQPLIFCRRQFTPIPL